MKLSFNVVDMPTADMIKDQLPIEDIIAVTQFQTCIACGASIESLKVVDIDQHIEDESILTMIYLIAVVNGEDFKIIFSFDNDEILKAVLTFDQKQESKERVMEYVRNILS